MFNRRQFLTSSLKGSSLLALGSLVPDFVANTAQAAEAGKDTVLVIIELSGGNDGLNTVIPFADDLYHKARPTLAFKKEQVLRVNDTIGLHPSLRGLQQMLHKEELAIVQGVGYPNPDRSHFEAMDIWQSADPKRQMNSGWIGRSVPDLQDKRGNVPVMQIGPNRLPLALQGGPGGVVSINNEHPYQLELGTKDKAKQKTRKRLLEDLAGTPQVDNSNALLQFVRRRQVQTYSTLERLEEALQVPNQQEGQFAFSSLSQKMKLIGRLIEKGFGTRVFYVNLDGFDTHSKQADTQSGLLRELGDAISFLFNDLQRTDHAKRVLVMTFSEFGRRVQENGSKGTDHGAASCMFVAGPAVQGGPLGKHPSLKDLDAGDLKHQVDFRSVYATLLDQWLGCDSKTVLGGTFDHVKLVKGKV